MTIFELCALIDHLREMERAHALPEETLIELDREVRQLLFGNDELTIHNREIAQDYYISTLGGAA